MASSISPSAPSRSFMPAVELARRTCASTLLGFFAKAASARALASSNCPESSRNVPGLHLRLGIVRQQVRRSHVLPERVAEVTLLRVRLCQLQAGFAELGVLLDGVPVLDDGFLGLAFGQVLVAAGDVLLLRDLGVLGTASDDDERCEHEGGDDPSAHGKSPGIGPILSSGPDDLFPNDIDTSTRPRQQRAVAGCWRSAPRSSHQARCTRHFSPRTPHLTPSMEARADQRKQQSGSSGNTCRRREAS